MRVRDRMAKEKQGKQTGKNKSLTDDLLIQR